MAPGVLKTSDVVGGISWENSIHVLNKAGGEETAITETFKAALMMGMLPQEYQESVFYKICIDPAKGMKDIPEYVCISEGDGG